MLPEGFLERMQRMLGEEYEAFLATYGQERCQALRLNALKMKLDGRSAAQVLAEGFIRLEKVSWAEDGYYYQAQDQPGKHPYHEAGLYYIQEPSAMVPAELLGVQPGERVLDLCAAPGGKSTQIAAKLHGEGILICNEIHPARAKILSENIQRMGICNACVTNETPERLAGLFPGYFDRILVDAPCSGEGMFRKNEEACVDWSLENVSLCADRQDKILDCAAEMLRPGGRLVYSTCTFAPEENEGSIDRFLDRHGDFEKVSATRLWPHRVKGEGHFCAVLQKAGGVPEKYQGNAVSGTVNESISRVERETENKTVDKAVKRTKNKTAKEAAKGNEKGTMGKELGDFVDFCYESLNFPGLTSGGNAGQGESDFDENRRYGNLGNMPIGNQRPRGNKDGRRRESKGNGEPSSDDLLQKIGSAVGMGGMLQILRFGGNIYLVPAEMPSLKGVKVLRAGLHLGELKKNRFEPSHALALALAPGNAVHVWNLDSNGNDAAAFLNGQTFPAEGEKGWYLICVDGFSLGWGKLAGGIMKNHYPKGLRR